MILSRITTFTWSSKIASRKLAYARATLQSMQANGCKSSRALISLLMLHKVTQNQLPTLLIARTITRRLKRDESIAIQQKSLIPTQ